MKLKLPEHIKPYAGIIYFMVILLASHYFWKFFILGDDLDQQVTFFGLDISGPFIYMSKHIAISTHKILNFIGFDTMLADNNVVRHLSGSRGGVCVVWSCSGIKQAYIFFCIIALYKGPWKHKAWFIPLGLLAVYAFNLFRIVFITAVIKKHPDHFDLWHEYILKYAFYGMIFLLWVYWNERFVLEKSPTKVESGPSDNGIF